MCLHECLAWHGQASPCVSRGSFFKGLRQLTPVIQLPSFPPQGYISVQNWEQRKQGRTILVSCLPAILHHLPASPGHGHLVSNYTRVSCHFKPTSTGTISTAATDTISARLPLWPGVSFLLNFSILVISASSVALKIIC